MASIYRRMTAEAVGSFFLFATVVGSGIMGESLSDGNVAIALLANTLATGAILFVLIAMLAPISGAHFNPAVTFAFWMRQEIGAGPALVFVVAQLGGGLLGVWAAHGMFEQEIWQLSERLRTGTGQWLGETIATFGLVLTILGFVRYRPNWVAPAVGLYIAAAYWFTSSTSFANPAITVGRALTNTFSGIAPANVPFFVLMQFAGAAIAVWLAGYLFSPEKE